MPVTLLVGAQWGDEGKGKFIDFLSQHADVTVRFHGGNNAGHTVINNFGKFPMHLIPCGIFAKQTKACICNGVILDLEVLEQEITLLEKAGFPLKERLFISPRCHIILPYHRVLDKLYEEAKGKAKTGTTGRGIGPAYADKVSYNGLRLSDALNKKNFSQKLNIQLGIKNKLIKALGGKACRQSEIEKQTFYHIKKLAPYIREPYPILQKALRQNKHILLEGAHGVFLDNDWGTYPFVTASTVLTGGMNAGTGMPAQKITAVLGITKAYTTRVGAGPFPTELFDHDGDTLRKEGNEYGTTTGRPRRCGWFDAVLLQFAAEINGFTGIALTKLDVLDTFKTIRVCIGYTYKGKRVNYFDGNDQMLTEVKPIYKIVPGWQTTTKGMTKFDQLPQNAQKYILLLEKLLGIPVQFISTGPDRHETIIR